MDLVLRSQADTSGSSTVIPRNSLYTLIWIEFGIATVVIALRAYSQFFISRKPSIDDLIMLGAWICQGVASVLTSTSTYWGLGLDFATLSKEQLVNEMKYTMIAMPFGVLSPMLGRISFILFLLVSVITIYPNRRRVLWALIIAQVLVNVIPIVLQFTQCKPVSALWNPFALKSACERAWVVHHYGYFQGAFNALTDTCLILMALALVVSLKLPLHKRIILGFVLSLSTLALVATILKTIQLYAMAKFIVEESSTDPAKGTFDVSYANAMWSIWFLTEGAVVITTASAPRIQAILVLRRRETQATSDSSSGHNAPVQESQKTSQQILLNKPLPALPKDALLWPGLSNFQWSSHGSMNSSDSILMENGRSHRIMK